MNVNTGLPEFFPEFAAGRETADMVVDHTYSHSTPCRLDQGALKAASDVVIINDVVLDVDVVTCVVNIGDESVHFLTCVGEHRSGVSFVVYRASQ